MRLRWSWSWCTRLGAVNKSCITLSVALILRIPAELRKKVLLVAQKVEVFPGKRKINRDWGDRNRIKAAQQRWGNGAANGMVEGEECPPAALIISQRVTWKRVG